MTRSLSADLEELERTDPVVRAAAANYDRVVARILAMPLTQQQWDHARLMAIGCASRDRALGGPWSCVCVGCRISRREVARRAVARMIAIEQGAPVTIMYARRCYLLCLTCRRAWFGPVAASCCAASPLVVSPWSDDARVWFRARLADGWRAAAVSARGNLASAAELRAALGLGVASRGRQWSTWAIEDDQHAEGAR